MTDDTLPPDAAESGATPDAAPPAPDEPFTPPWVCTAASPLAATLDAHVDAPVRPVALWPSGQHSDAAQRVGRYAPDAPKHPARLLPDEAARIIDRFSQPGQTVLGLFCGAGTSLVEAVYAGRDALGIDNDRRWAAAARANLAYAHQHGATGAWKLMRADARFLPDVPRRKRGSVVLLIATPPTRLTPIRPGTNPRSNQELIDRLDSDLITTLDACRPLLRPGGTIVIVTRLIRRAEHGAAHIGRDGDRPARCPRPGHRSRTAHQGWTVEAVRALGMTTDVATAAAILGFGRTKAYELAKNNQFPVQTLRIGRRYLVPVSAILRLLDAD